VFFFCGAFGAFRRRRDDDVPERYYFITWIGGFVTMLTETTARDEVVFVSGVTGLLGNHVVRLALEHGFKEVRALVRSKEKAQKQFGAQLPERLTLCLGDMTEVDKFAQSSQCFPPFQALPEKCGTMHDHIYSRALQRKRGWDQKLVAGEL
jgi:hypothetical protein